MLQAPETCRLSPCSRVNVVKILWCWVFSVFHCFPPDMLLALLLMSPLLTLQYFGLCNSLFWLAMQLVSPSPCPRQPSITVRVPVGS